MGQMVTKDVCEKKNDGGEGSGEGWRWSHVVKNVYNALFAGPGESGTVIYAQVASLFPNDRITGKQVGLWCEGKTPEHEEKEQKKEEQKKEVIPQGRNRELLLALETVANHYQGIKDTFRAGVSGLLMIRPLRAAFVAQLPEGMAREVFEKAGFLHPERMEPEDWDFAVRGVLIALTRAWLRAIDMKKPELARLVVRDDDSDPSIKRQVMEAALEDYFKVTCDPGFRSVQIALRHALAKKRLAAASTSAEKDIAQSVVSAVEQEMATIPIDTAKEVMANLDRLHPDKGGQRPKKGPGRRPPPRHRR